MATKLNLSNGDLAKIMAAKKSALEYSRKLPMRQFSPYGGWGIDERASRDAFRQCFEALSMCIEIESHEVAENRDSFGGA